MRILLKYFALSSKGQRLAAILNGNTEDNNGKKSVLAKLIIWICKQLFLILQEISNELTFLKKCFLSNTLKTMHFPASTTEGGMVKKQYTCGTVCAVY